MKKAANPSPQASPEPRLAPFVDPPHADLLTADDWMHLHVDYDVQGPDRGYIGYIRKDNGQLLSIEDVVQLYGDYVEKFVRETRVTAPVGDPMTMQDLYEAYLLGCEDECIPEPKTIEQFAQMLIPQCGTALASPPQIARENEEICTTCGNAFGVWFAPNEVWNAVIHERVGMLCPTCFMKRAEHAVISFTGWELRPENLEIRGRGRKDESSLSERHGISNPDNAGSTPAVPSSSALASPPQIAQLELLLLLRNKMRNNDR